MDTVLCQKPLRRVHVRLQTCALCQIIRQRSVRLRMGYKHTGGSRMRQENKNHNRVHYKHCFIFNVLLRPSQVLQLGQDPTKRNKTQVLGLPWWSMVKNPPSNAGDVGLIPGQGTKIPHDAGQPSLCALEPAHHNGEPGCCNQDLMQPNK